MLSAAPTPAEADYRYRVAREAIRGPSSFVRPEPLSRAFAHTGAKLDWRSHASSSSWASSPSSSSAMAT